MDAYEIRRKKDLAPFNDNMSDVITIYDHLFYTMDIDLCPRDLQRLVSGNIIKGFRCIVTDTFSVPLNQ